MLKMWKLLKILISVIVSQNVEKVEDVGSVENETEIINPSSICPHRAKEGVLLLVI